MGFARLAREIILPFYYHEILCLVASPTTVLGLGTNEPGQVVDNFYGINTAMK